MEPQTERRQSVSSKELELLKELLSSRLTAHETLDTQRFDAMEKVSAERHEHVRLRLEAVGKNVHDLRGQLTETFALPGRMARVEDELKHVPRKEDLEHVSKTIHTRFDTFEKARADEKEREVAQAKKDKEAAASFRWKVGIAVAIGGPLSLLILQMIFKKFGLL